jgi:hypothetical protein
VNVHSELSGPLVLAPLVSRPSCRDLSLPLLMSLIAILLPLSAAEAGPTHGFVKDANMWQDGVAFHANGVSASLYFRSDAVVIEMKNPTIFSGGSPDPAGCTVWMRFQGANPSPTISGQGEMMTRYSYYLGSDPEGWALNVPVYSGVVYRDLWPGIDLTFTELPGVISYVISLEEWADLDDVQFSFEGADQVTQTDPYTWTILTGLGQLRFRRDAHLQRAGWLQFPGEAKADKGLSDDPPDIRWGSFLGGGANVGDMSLARDANGNIYVAGTIGSSFLSSLPGDFDAEKMGPSLVFVSKLDPTGSRLMWSTFLGGSGSDEVADIALDGEGNPVLTGTTGSTDFPLTQGAYRTSHGGNHEAFVLELTGSYGHLAYSTLVGHGYARALAVDGSGRPLVAGQAFGDFPTSVNGYDRTYDGTGDAFVAKLSATGRALVWATFLGGNFPDEALDLALDGASRPVVVGRTRSSDFPTSSGAYDRSQNGGEDAFLSCLTADGTGLAWSTLLGGGQDDRALAVSLDPTGRPVVSGWTASSSFPTTSGAHDRVLSAGYGQGDIFVSKLAPTGSGLTWSTFLGGAQDDVPYGLVLDDGGNVLVTGGLERHRAGLPRRTGRDPRPAGCRRRLGAGRLVPRRRRRRAGHLPDHGLVGATGARRSDHVVRVPQHRGFTGSLLARSGGGFRGGDQPGGGADRRAGSRPSGSAHPGRDRAGQLSQSLQSGDPDQVLAAGGDGGHHQDLRCRRASRAHARAGPAPGQRPARADLERAGRWRRPATLWDLSLPPAGRPDSPHPSLDDGQVTSG